MCALVCSRLWREQEKAGVETPYHAMWPGLREQGVLKSMDLPDLNPHLEHDILSREQN